MCVQQCTCNGESDLVTSQRATNRDPDSLAALCELLQREVIQILVCLECGARNAIVLHEWRCRTERFRDGTRQKRFNNNKWTSISCEINKLESGTYISPTRTPRVQLQFRCFNFPSNISQMRSRDKWLTKLDRNVKYMHNANESYKQNTHQGCSNSNKGEIYYVRSTYICSINGNALNISWAKL